MSNKLLPYLNELLSADPSIDEKEHPRNKNKHWKFLLIVSLVALGIVAVIIRLFVVQVVNGDKYSEMAKRQHESKMVLPAQRGIIYDRNGKVLATNIMTLSIAIDPKISTKKTKIIEILSKNLNLNKNVLTRKVNTKKRFVWLVRGVNPDLVEELYDVKDKGLILVDEPRRYYPYGEVASQIIGYTNIDNKGISGIEYLNDSSLKGKDGFIMLQRDARQREYASAEMPKVEPHNGYNIQLTLDVELQRILEFELSKGIEWSGAKGGIGVSIKPQTGEVLAIANFPLYNPNDRSSIKFENTKLKAITDEYAPGSTFKLITTAAGLQEGVISETDTVNGHNGELSFSWGTIRDVHKFSKSTFKEAVWYSSNIVMSSVADKISDGKFYSYVRNFGFGNELDIDLPGEIAGKVKKPEQFYKSSKRYMGHGYDMTATPLQVVNAYATVANNGVMMQPYLLKRVYDKEHDLINKEPIRIRKVIDEEIANRVRKLFIGVVDSGSGKRARVEGMKIAGKTGTSQRINEFGKYSKSEYYASFAGFFPANNPEVAMLIIVDTPTKSIYGGVNAAPIFKEIATRWLQLRSGKMNIPVKEEGKDSVLVPNLIGMNYTDVENLKSYFHLEIEGNKKSGMIFFQNPKAGDVVAKNSKILVQLISRNKKLTDFKIFDVTGMPLRRALNLLHTSNVLTKVHGTGIVKSQKWSKDGDVVYCTLTCE